MRTGRLRAALAVAAWTVAAASCTGATKVTSGGVGGVGGAGGAGGDGAPGAGGSEVADASTTTTTTQPPPVECRTELTLEQKVGQMLMVLVSDPTDALAVVSAGQVGGYALVGTQDEGVGAGVTAVNDAAPLPVFAAGDEEGGSVQRLRTVLGRLPAAREMVDGSTPEEAAARFGEYAAAMRELGLDMNLGPSADVGGGAGLGNRSFSDDVDTVAEFSVAVSAAVRAAGVTPVAKHWPGIGSGDADPHQGATVVDDIDTLRRRDLVVFDRLIEAGAPAIMVSHAVVPGLTDDLPASISSAAITDELRERQGFGGVIMTDSLGMGAVTARFDDPRAAREAIVAGADIALLSGVAFVPDAIERLVAAVEESTLTTDRIDESVDRILRLKGIEGPCPLPGGG